MCIKREDAIKIIKSLPRTDSSDHTKKKNLILLFTLYDATDVVEVVRCKDCVYRPCEMMPYSYDFDFCSYGERADT